MATDAMATEAEKVVDLKGMPSNPGREPKSKANASKGSMGDRALMDAIIIVAIAWAIILLLAISLRHHNV